MHQSVSLLQSPPSKTIDQEKLCKVETLACQYYLTNGAAAQFALVPSKYVLVSFQDLPELLLPMRTQIGADLDSFIDLLPPNPQLRMAIRCKFLSGLAIKVANFYLDSLE
jgi:hypothetical protein